MTTTNQTNPTAWLIAINGPPLSALALLGPPQGITLGRAANCDICMPAGAEGVSRRHARLRWDEGQWLLADLNSRWGTHLNGTRLDPETEVPLTEADLVGIGPWTMKLSSEPKPRGLQSKDDTGQSIITSRGRHFSPPLAENLLKLLLEGATTIHAAKTENDLAAQIISVAQAGTGLRQAFVLRPVDASGGIQIIASSASASSDNGAPQQFSRSLIAAAANGNVAELREHESEEYGQSIAQLDISCAICVPLMLGESPAAFLYLDSRGGRTQSLPPQASAFCTALAAMASLALANLKRIDLEKREAAMRMELNTAAAAQAWIMPRREGTFGKFATIGESRPGQLVGGDFFDLIDLGDGRLVVALGDVAGKGIVASVLMTAAQGYFHAAIARRGEPGQAMTDLNDFIIPRRPEHRFLTMWVGLFDLQQRTIQYVDAGHGYALRKRGDEMIQLNEGGGMPIGVTSQKYTAESIDLAEGDEVVIVSDGFVEQPSTSDVREQFDMKGVRNAFRQVKGGDPVDGLFRALISHAGSNRLADDATAVLIRCCGK